MGNGLIIRFLSKNWKESFSVLAVASAIIMFNMLMKERKLARTYEENFTRVNKSLIYTKDKLNQEVARSAELNVSISDLKSMTSSSNKSLNKLSNELIAMQRKLKNVESAMYIAISSTGGGTVYFGDTVYIPDGDTVYVEQAKYEDDWLSFYYDRYNTDDTATARYTYREEIVSAVDRERRKEKLDGGKIFLLWRVLGLTPYDYYLETKSLNPNSKIGSQTYLRFRDHKRKKRNK